MYAHELFENPKPRVVVTYPGRFQPFHQGHAGVFAQLQKKFGNENVFIATSNDTSSAKSPFNFNDKYQLITAAGVPGNHIVETNSMYSLPNDFNPATTVFVTAVGAPDADRLNPDSYLKRDKKDKEGNIIKPAGSPGYYKTYNPKEKPLTADQFGYVIVIPEIHKNIKINNATYDVSHGKECRNLWNSIRNDEKARSQFLSQLYGRADKHLGQIFDKIPAPTQEDIDPRATDTASPIPGGVKKGTVGPVEAVEKELPSNTLYFFDVEKGGRSFSHLDLKIMGLQKSLKGKWYYQPGRDSSDIITNATLRHLEKTLNVPARAWKKPMEEDAAGVGVVATNKKMARDPRYSMSITKDVKPTTPKNQLRAFRLSESWTNKYLKENINPEDFEITKTDKLDVILSYLCKMVIEGQKTNKDLFGMVAACVLDTDNRAVFGINYFNDATDNRVHAERCALDQYRAHYGEPPSGSIILTTLSPCCHLMEERYGESCTELINDTDIHKVYCGYKDPTQEESMNRTFHIKQTRNTGIINLCKSFADTFLSEDKEKKCPPATQDIGLNLKNRQKAINEYGYGPLNPDLPNLKFWMKKVDEWNLDSMEEAQQSLCGNCAAFDQRQETLDCIAQGIGSDQGAEDPTIDAGDLGYCRFLKFKCASRRTCDAWVTGGPLTDKAISEDNFRTAFTLDENFTDGRNPKDKGDSKRYGVPTKASVSTLRKVAKQGGRKGQLAHWMANMKSGKQKANENVVATATPKEPDFPSILAKFLPIAMKDLGINKLPRINLEKHLETHNGQATFGRFVNDENAIHLAIADRHPIDILRTLAHELTHFRQFMNKQLNHNSGETGSPEENEAHVMAGIIMRHFDKAYPDLLKLNPLDMS